MNFSQTKFRKMKFAKEIFTKWSFAELNVLPKNKILTFLDCFSVVNTCSNAQLTPVAKISGRQAPVITIHNLSTGGTQCQGKVNLPKKYLFAVISNNNLFNSKIYQAFWKTLLVIIIEDYICEDDNVNAPCTSYPLSYCSHVDHGEAVRFYCPLKCGVCGKCDS